MHGEEDQIAGPYQYSYDNNGNQTGITSTLGDYSSSTTFNVDNRMASAVTTFGSTNGELHVCL